MQSLEIWQIVTISLQSWRLFYACEKGAAFSTAMQHKSCIRTASGYRILGASKMGKILAVVCCLLLAGCNDNATQNDAATITRDYQDSQHAINDAIFEREKLACALHRKMLLSQH